MQKFLEIDNGNPDGTAKDAIVGVSPGTNYKSKVWNDNLFNLFKFAETQGYTLIDDDLSQISKASRALYNPAFIYNTSAIATQTVNDIVLGSDGVYYEADDDGINADNPVGSVTGKWKVSKNQNKHGELTLATLRQVTEPTPIVYVSGHTSENDGAFGSLFWLWDSTNTDDDDNGRTIKLASIATGRYKLQYSGELDAKWYGSPKNPIFNPSKLHYYTENNIDTDLTEIVSEGGDYQSFPQVAQAPNGNIVLSWNHQQQHTGGGLANVETKVSSDGGNTWTTTNVIYGNLSGGDPLEPFWHCSGVDKDGRFVIIFGITDGAANRPWITYSIDGLVWTDIEPLTFDVDPNPGGSVVPFGQIKLLPSGKMGLVFYIGDNNYVGIIDPDNPLVVALKLVVISSSPSYSEAVFLPISENVWYYFLREDGVAGTVPYYTTIDGGANWVDKGNTGDIEPTDFVDSGGWLPQSASIIERNGESYIMLGLGVRKTVSLPYPTAPSIVFMVAKEKDVFTNSSGWDKLQEMTFVDDGFDRDAYVNFIQAPDGNTFVVTNEETAVDESRILIGQFNSHKSIAEDTGVDVVLDVVGTGGSANAFSGTPILKYIKRENLVSFYGSVVFSAVNSTGALKITGFPFTLSTNNQVMNVLVYNVSGVTEIGIRSISGTGDFQLVESYGASNLDSSEILSNCNIRFSGTVIID